MPEWFLEKLKNADRTDTYEVCKSASCEAPPHKYQRVIPTQPGIQWDQHGGYCGAWSVQRAAMAKGAYISQQQVRDHAKYGGGHDEEILNTNIDGALKKLKIKAEGFEYNVLPEPQSEEYLSFMKKQLIVGNAVIWMVMFSGDSYPDDGYEYDNTTNGIYGHIEPVVGILSNHPLSDETVHDDDVFAYYDDASKTTHYVTPRKVPGDCSFGTGGHCRARCRTGLFGQCVWKERGYMWGIQGFADEHDAVPLSLSISPWASEPYTRGGAKPIEITGTLTATALRTGSKYDVYRWNSAEEAFYYNETNKIASFTASSDTHVFEDPTKFLSSSATYYRCVIASSGAVFV